MDTRSWGAPTWDTLFFVAGGYDLNEEPRETKDEKYYTFFQNFGEVIPCRYCRNSYKGFFQELNLQDYFGEKCGVMRFVYDLKNKVNNKLWKQEYEAAMEKYNALKQNEATLTQDQIAEQLRDISKIFYTKDPPPFSQVVEKYMKHRAKCSPKMKTCRKDAVDTLDEEFLKPSPTTEVVHPTDTMVYASKGGSKPKRSKSKKRSLKKKSRGRSRSSRSRKH